MSHPTIEALASLASLARQRLTIQVLLWRLSKIPSVSTDGELRYLITALNAHMQGDMDMSNDKNARCTVGDALSDAFTTFITSPEPRSYMSTKWPTMPVDQVFTSKRVALLDKLCRSAGLPLIEGRDIWALKEAVDFLLAFLELDIDDCRYVVDQKRTPTERPTRLVISGLPKTNNWGTGRDKVQKIVAAVRASLGVEPFSVYIDYYSTGMCYVSCDTPADAALAATLPNAVRMPESGATPTICGNPVTVVLSTPPTYDRVKPQKDTVKAVWPNTTKDERAELHRSLHSSKSYRAAVELFGILAGRLKNMFGAAIVAECKQINKHGSFVLRDGEDYDLHTVVFCLIFKSFLDERNAFTIKSQMQGGMPSALKVFMDTTLRSSETTQWSLIASLYPVATVVEHLDISEKTSILAYWMSKLKGMAAFLEDQWDRGVDDCARNRWMVPRRGSDVDSSGWNAVAGAWNNAIRHIKVLSAALDVPFPFIFMVPRLTAGDQMEWAAAAGKEDDPKLTTVTALVATGLMPWSALDEAAVPSTIYTAIAAACAAHSVPLERFFGLPKARLEKTIRAVQDMICGVAVSVSKPLFEALKLVGFAGSKPHNKFPVPVPSGAAPVPASPVPRRAGTDPVPRRAVSAPN